MKLISFSKVPKSLALSVFYKNKRNASIVSILAFRYGRSDRVRVSGGHLCAEHRSTDRGGSRDLEGAASCSQRIWEYLFPLISRHFRPFPLENGMDVKTLLATIGHVSAATTLDIYSHMTDTMQMQAAVSIDRKIGGTNAQRPESPRRRRNRP